jgi:hypothetical protein
MSQVRLLLTDAAWQELAVILETVQPQAGSPDRVWAMGRRLQSLSPLGEAPRVAAMLATPPVRCVASGEAALS